MGTKEVNIMEIEANTDLYEYRPIKFRAWSTKFKKFLAVGFHIIGETTLFDMLNSHTLEELDTIKIQEWIGLTTKDGKDIYEGDILRWEESRSWEEGGGYDVYYYVVKWDKEYLKWVFEDPFSSEKWDAGDTAFDSVVGNIFEDSEMLQ